MFILVVLFLFLQKGLCDEPDPAATPLPFNDFTLVVTEDSSYCEDKNGTICISKSQVSSYNFIDFKDSRLVKILLFENLEKEQTFNFKKLPGRRMISISSGKQQESETTKYSFTLNVITMGQNIISLSFNSINLGFVYDIRHNFVTCDYLYFNDCTLQEQKICTELKLPYGTSYNWEGQQCFGVDSVKYATIFVTEDDCAHQSKQTKCIKPSEVSSYDFSDFKGRSYIEIDTSMNLDNTTTFKFNKLQTRTSVVFKFVNTDDDQKLGNLTIDLTQFGRFIKDLIIYQFEISYLTDSAHNYIRSDTISMEKVRIANPIRSCRFVHLNRVNEFISADAKLKSCYGVRTFDSTSIDFMKDADSEITSKVFPIIGLVAGITVILAVFCFIIPTIKEAKKKKNN